MLPLFILALIAIVWMVIRWQRQQKRKKTLAETIRCVIPLLIFVICCLCSIKLINALHRAKLQVRKMHYVNTIYGMGQLLERYAQSHDGTLPSASSWLDDLLANDANDLLMYKQLQDAKEIRQYRINNLQIAFNSTISNQHLSGLPADTIVLFNAEGACNNYGGEPLFKGWFATHEYNYVFLADGRVGVVEEGQDVVTLIEVEPPYRIKEKTVPLRFSVPQAGPVSGGNGQ